LAVAAALAVSCGPGAGKRQADNLLDARRFEAAGRLVRSLERRFPGDTGVQRLAVRLYAAERRLALATDALRRLDSLGAGQDTALVKVVLRAGLKDANVGTVVVALEAIGELGLSGMWDDVLDACGDRDEPVRVAAYYALPRCGGERAVEALATGVLDGDPNVRAEMLKSATRLGDKRMLDITRVLQFESNDYVIWKFIVMRAVLGGGTSSGRCARRPNPARMSCRSTAAPHWR
jgi:hypothetical protein